MSDDVLKLIPQDPKFVPAVDQYAKAEHLLQEMLPDGEMCETRVHDRLEFIDQGENITAVDCSACGNRLPIDFLTEGDLGASWWQEMGIVLQDRSCEDLEVTMPCCNALTKFTSLEFDRPAGFARFELVIWNPNIGKNLDDVQLRRLEEILDCQLNQVRAYY